MTSSQKPDDDIICSGVTPFLLFSQYGILYAEHQNIFPFRKLLFYSAQYFPVSEAKPHKPQLHFGSLRGAVCGSCGMKQKKKLTSVPCRILHSAPVGKIHYFTSCQLGTNPISASIREIEIVISLVDNFCINASNEP